MKILTYPVQYLSSSNIGLGARMSRVHRIPGLKFELFES